VWREFRPPGVPCQPAELRAGTNYGPRQAFGHDGAGGATRIADAWHDLAYGYSPREVPIALPPSPNRIQLALQQPSQQGRALTRSTAINSDGVTYRDLNGNGVMEPYEDPRRRSEERVADLLPRLSAAEKVGLLFHTILGVEVRANTTSPSV
jgi:hypothetical protein